MTTLDTPAVARKPRPTTRVPFANGLIGGFVMTWFGVILILANWNKPDMEGWLDVGIALASGGQLLFYFFGIAQAVFMGVGAARDQVK
jgi:hypothetical protein